jgi:hypothetical protein
MAVKSTPIGVAKIGPTQSIAVAEPEVRQSALSRDLPRPGQRGYPRHARSLTARAMRQRLLLIALVLAMAAAGSVIEGPRLFGSGNSGDQQNRRQAPVEPSPAEQAAAAARNQAAVWIRQWVAANADVACDPVMCGVLAAHGVAAARVQELSTSAIDPLTADVVVATLAIRNQYRGRLARVYAPAVLARFGTGDAEVDVRVVGQGKFYLRALRSDVAARKSAGAMLLHNAGISAAGLAARELADGEVDSRLLAILVALVHWGCPVRVLSFGGRGPGSTSGMPLLSAEITPLVSRRGVRLTSGRSHAEIVSEVRRIERFLNTQITPLRPASFAPSQGADGQMFVQVDFAAPAQLGVLGGIPAETNSISAPQH